VYPVVRLLRLLGPLDAVSEHVAYTLLDFVSKLAFCFQALSPLLSSFLSPPYCDHGNQVLHLNESLWLEMEFLHQVFDFFILTATRCYFCSS